MTIYAVGFDVGGTKIEAALVRFEEAPSSVSNLTPSVGASAGASAAPKANEFPFEDRNGRLLRGQVLARSRVATERQHGYEPIVEKMVGLVRTVCAQAGVSPDSLAGLGFAIPGAVDPVSLRMLNGNTLVLKNRDLTQDVVRGLGFAQGALVVKAENDANCFALGEALCGVGVAHAAKEKWSARKLTSVGIILGTGCGGGVVVNGDTLRGRRGGAGEVGHTVLKEGGLPCYCGQRGCAEQYLSGSGIEQAFNARRYAQVREFQDARSVFALAEAKDPIAVATVRAFRSDLAQFLAGLTSLFDPDFFVLGGGVSLQPAVYEDLESEVARLSFLPDSRVPVYQNVLGDSAGVVGASLLVVKDL